jgi:hypothetical protein
VPINGVSEFLDCRNFFLKTAISFVTPIAM